MGNEMVTSEIRKQFHTRFVKIKAQEIITLLKKLKGTYVLISRDSIPFGYLLIPWATNYVHRYEFLT